VQHFPNGAPDFDGVRRKRLVQLADFTGRPVTLYASGWMAGLVEGPNTPIGLQDMQGLIEVFQRVVGPNLDLILSSPGGDAATHGRRP
jgi:hypothetical protein